MLFLPLALALAAVDVAPSHHIADHVSLALTTDRQAYAVGEPVTLTLTIENVGSTPIFGLMQLAPQIDEAFKTDSLFYCRDRGACVEFRASMGDMCMQVTPYELAPGKSQRSQFVVAVNPANGRLVLDESGDYEFRLETCGGVQLRRARLTRQPPCLSASAYARVADTAESDAFRLYSEAKLAGVAQYNPTFSLIGEQQLNDARTLLERYPDSVYAKALHRGLAAVLEARRREGKLAAADALLLDTLHQLLRPAVR